MDIYPLLRNGLFWLPPEISHELSLKALAWAHRYRLLKFFKPLITPVPCYCMGLRFRHPIGLAAGLDKNGDYIDALGALGFSFIEVGTVTPKPQSGNPKPRLFRLPEQQAIINRMGFNNKGVDYLVERLKRRSYLGIVGVNIGKNKDTPLEQAIEDYLYCLERIYPYADYIVVNISSPNTPGLRDLQQGNALVELLHRLKERRESLRQEHDVKVPLLLKIAPDLAEIDLVWLGGQLLEAGWDGVIATNTTVSRQGIENALHGDEAGGLSGSPLFAHSTEVLASLADVLQDRVPIIGVGGVMVGKQAAEKMRAGASLVQLYSGFIYRGPKLIQETVNAVRDLVVRRK